MNTTTNLTDLIAAVTAHEGSWGSSRMDWDEEANAFRLSRNDSELALQVDFFLWATYDAGDDFIFPTIRGWEDLLERTMGDDSYGNLSKEEVLSILFGIHHRNRVHDGLWVYMLECGVTQKLLGRLLEVDTDEC